jgi:hypothetical protein
MPSRRKKRILNCIDSRNTEKDWGIESAMNSGVLKAARALPRSKDLRANWWKVGDQGDTGSCVGWATADGVLRWHFVKEGKIRKDKPLSPRYIWMASKETDQFTSRPTTFIESEGTSLKAALDIARKFGSVQDAVLPFGSGQLYQGEEDTFYALAARLKISSYFNLGRDPDKWRRWLAFHGPILTRLEVDDTWYDASSNDGHLDIYRPDTAAGGHAVAFVGYTPDRFIVRNSWGTSWGDKGFAYASLSYAQAAFTEAYGVSVG